MSAKQDLIQELESIEAERKDLFSKKEPIDRQINITSNRIKTLKDKLAKEELKEEKTEEESIKYYLFHDGNLSKVRHEAQTKFWHEFCGHKGLHQAGYWPGINQVGLEIKLTYDDSESLEAHVQQLTKILPYVGETNGIKTFGIFEYTLSQYTSYSLTINETKREYNLCVSNNVSKSFSNLRDALIYIQEHHWYDGKHHYSEDEDYDG